MSEDRFSDPKLALNRIYTRTGDGGSTRLVGGQKVDKDALRIESYGTVDGLNCDVGAARLACLNLGLEALATDLLRVQHGLFNLGSALATLSEDLHPQQPRITQRDIDWLEARIDSYNAELPALRSFVLPGGNAANVELHRARTHCRKAERLCVTLARTEAIDGPIVPYLNRLSDAFFVWSRAAAVLSGDAEVLWAPNEA